MKASEIKDEDGKIIYPSSTCMNCGKDSPIWGEVDIGQGIIELWCYCKECNIETFHPIPHYNKDNLNLNF